MGFLMVLFKLLHVVVALFLILVVLLQTGKGAEMGAAFGGASNTVFGSSGPAGFMARLTTTAAVLFMVTSLGLAYVSSAKSGGVVTPVPIGQTEPLEIPVPAPAEEGPAGTSANP